MNKILLVSKREFLTRVQKKTFLLTTILLPLTFVGFYALIIYFSVSTGNALKITVSDNANIFRNKIDNTSEVHFNFVQNETPESLKAKLASGQYDGYVYIPASFNVHSDSIQLVSEKSLGLLQRGKIEDIFNTKLRENRLLSLNITREELDSVQKNKGVNFATVGGSKDSE